MLKVKVLNSLQVKLFFLVTGLICLTVAGNSFQNYEKFQQFLTRQAQDSIGQQAKASAEEVSNILENWLSQVSVVVPNLGGVTKENAVKQIENLVSSNREFVAFHVVSLPANVNMKNIATKTFSSVGFNFTSRVDDTRFDQQDTSKIAEKIEAFNRKWLVQRITKDPQGTFFLVGLSDQFKLPLVNLAYRFSFAQSKESVWAVLTAWQTRITSSLPNAVVKGKVMMQGVIINQNGHIIASPNVQDMMVKRSVKDLPLALDALSGKMAWGIKDNFKDQYGQAWIGAFRRLPQLDKISVLVQKDAESAFLSTQKIIRRTALWGGLFILIAVLFSFVLAAGITKALRELTEATFRIAKGNFATSIKPKSADEVGALSIAINNMSQKILILLEEQVQKARVEKELETAKMVQDTFFPKRDIRQGPLFVTGFHQSASETGGDLWGHFSASEGVEYIFIADAMGHGAPAALVTAIGYSTCMAIADMIGSESNIQVSPARILERLNRVIFDAVQGGTTMTYFIAAIDTKSGVLTYANAGHNFPFIIPMKLNDPRVKRASKDANKIQSIALSLKGNPLGVERNVVFQEKTMNVAAGDKLFFYTDGLIDCTSPVGRKLSRKDLVEQATQLAQCPALQIRDSMIESAFALFDNNALIDDVTLVVAEIDQSWNVHSGSPANSGGSASKPPPPPPIKLEKEPLPALPKIA